MYTFFWRTLYIYSYIDLLPVSIHSVLISIFGLLTTVTFLHTGFAVTLCTLPYVSSVGQQHTKCNKFWIKIDQLHVTRFIISLFTAQHVSNVSTSIFRSLGLIVGLFHVLYCSGSMCVGVTVWFSWGGVVSLYRLKYMK